MCQENFQCDRCDYAPGRKYGFPGKTPGSAIFSGNSAGTLAWQQAGAEKTPATGWGEGASPAYGEFDSPRVFSEAIDHQRGGFAPGWLVTLCCGEQVPAAAALWVWAMAS